MDAKANHLFQLRKLTHKLQRDRQSCSKWELIDSCWAAGTVSSKTKRFTRRFEPWYFTCQPDAYFWRAGVSEWRSSQQMQLSSRPRPRVTCHCW